MEPLISIIIPVYNVEKYIGRCIESVLAQTYRNIELILVDDESKDSSGDVCDFYAGKDERVKVIHKKNEGAGEARNTGIDVAKGECFVFIDSDDYVSEEYIEILYRTLEEEKCDIVQCDYEVGVEEKFDFEKRNVLRKEVLDNHTTFYTRNTKILIWGKIFRRELFDDIRYPKVSEHDDEFIVYKLLYAATKIVLIHHKMYYYFQAPNSIMRNEKRFYSENFIRAYNERIQYFSDRNEDMLVKVSYKEKCIRLMLLFIKCCRNKDNENDKSKLLKMFKSDYLKAKEAKMNIKEKVSLSLFYIVTLFL